MQGRSKAELKKEAKDPNLQPGVRTVAPPKMTQDDYDRRWRNLCAYEEALPQEQKATTLGGHRDLLAKFGMELVRPMSAEEAATTADFRVFMERYGRLGTIRPDSYEMEGLPDAKPKCDCCKKVGATKRCNKCREWYCSRECQKAAWPEHKRVCRIVSGQLAFNQLGDDVLKDM